ncbi:hypothetical protein B0T25DRAFT_511465 [Lasiosphaeria hispida]|uniref:Zn(2)-C6 fungal-type domain-containing protein n=1 Tax=Lasiosphaeria hispida TaxID=260671 RepID=A0AAJ0H7B0_9PEZI|nr:hypothetical protein B0T25DRAFT_511465 [Lasiosphaeria hispida]
MRAEAELRRRKVRKGTRSCWECRRRKIRCQYGPGDDLVCLPCQARGGACRSQEFMDESRGQQPDRRLTQRLGRLEDLMSKLVSRIMPESTPARSKPGRSPRRPPPTPSDDGADADRSDPQAPQQPLTMLTPESLQTNHATPGSTSTSTGSALSPLERASQTLHTLFPSQHDVTIITKASAAPYFLASLFYSFHDVFEGRAETADSMSVIPPPTSHPTVLARRLLQVIVCMQQLPPTFDAQRLELKGPIPAVMIDILSNVSRLVNSDDEVVGTVEGLESLVVQGLWHANAGNLRKAWLSYRRAMNVAQLMCLDHECTRSLRSADPARTWLPTPRGIWYRIVSCDRFASLLLGLAVGSTDNSYAADEAMKRDTKMEKLEKLQTVITARIVERNANKKATADEVYTATCSIDGDLDACVRLMEDGWWDEPVLDPFEGKEHNLGLMFRLFRQVQHYDLLILLHLPYMLRHPAESRYEHSKQTCIRSSREVLKRFVSFRTLYNSAWSCRHIDYSALVASMTLLLSYLRQHQDALQPVPSCAQRAEDRALIDVVRARMQHIAVINQDKLSQQSAEIVGQMMTIIDSVNAAALGERGLAEFNENAISHLHLNIPYFGTVDIHPTIKMAAKTPAMAGLSTGVPTTTTSQGGVGELSPDDDMDFGGAEANMFSADTGMLSGMYMQFDHQPQEGVLTFPVTAEADDWIFQGVDTTYWSLLNENNTAG